MIYYIIQYLKEIFPDLPGIGLFNYITFRSTIATFLSLVVATIYGKKIITYLQRIQVKESIRSLGLAGEVSKSGTPTMGGIIIILACLIPTLLFARLSNVYILLCIISTLWLGIIGFIDDYIKVFKNDKQGLAGKFKLLGQVGLGIIISSTLYYNSNVTVLRVSPMETKNSSIHIENKNAQIQKSKQEKTIITNLPFIKDQELNYSSLLNGISEGLSKYTYYFYTLLVIFIIASVSNGANLTDGLDGLVAGLSVIIGLTLGILAYVSGNYIFSSYLNILYIPNIGELSVFIGAFVGACIGFLWYNSYPAKVFMGDTGSLMIGGILASLAIIVRKELLIPVLCGVFLIENLSVIIQVVYFKYTKKKYGIGKRIFLMSPLHHHYQKKGYHESTIVVRFWIFNILLAIISVLTLKIR